MYEITKAKIPIKMWIPPHEVESGALDQAINIANHPAAVHHLAIMPDVHVGVGAPIGAVAAMTAFVPTIVGVDIGCGVLAARTNLMREDLPKDLRKRILGGLREAIPTGFNHHSDSHPEWMPPTPDLDTMPMVRREWGSATRQVGTLGGGK